ncbi:hypothetical protein [Candidatus Magnetaquicoccus inordinatus]|uniref:hypothetical protein n=1 Tax=Candidatus Magnetaquicoccus inordinatus TaxID=2496818 RepID=UPI00102B1EDA|nr:hypothetical protein [Candidatus Magnetaquicoccus inordinatus]
MNTKMIIAFVVVALVSGCMSSVTRITPEEMRANPGSKISFDTKVPFDLAYRKTLNQMKGCWEQGSGVNFFPFASASFAFSVFGDKMENDAQVSLKLTTNLTAKIIQTIALNPIQNGTHVTIYFAGEKPPEGQRKVLQEWLDNDSQGCPGDVGFFDKVEGSEK